jgi:Carboxypeptidase regulatory-like domain
MAAAIITPSLMGLPAAPAMASPKASTPKVSTQQVSPKQTGPAQTSSSQTTTTGAVTLPLAPKISAPAAQPAAPVAPAAHALSPELMPHVGASCTATWTGGADDDQWTTAGNWQSDVVPGPTDFVCIGSGADAVTITNGTTVNILGISALGAGLIVFGPTACCGPPPAILNLTGSMSDASVINALNLQGTLDATAPVGLTGTGDLSNGILSGSGLVTLEEGSSTSVGGQSSATGSIDNQGALSVSSGALFGLSSTATFDNDVNGSVSLTGALTDSGTWTQGAGTVASTSPGLFTDSSAIPPVAMTGDGVLDFTGTGASAFVIDALGAQTIEGNIAAGQSVEVAGLAPNQCSINETRLTAATSFTNAGTITLDGINACQTGQATLVIPIGATLTNTGTIDVSGNGPPSTIQGNLTNSGTIALAAPATLNLSPSAITTLSAALTTAGPITSLPVAALPSALTAGSVTVSSAPDSQVFTTTGAAAGATAIPVTSVTPNDNYAPGSDVLSASTVLLNGAVQVPSGTTLNVLTGVNMVDGSGGSVTNAGTVAVAGTWTQGAGVITDTADGVDMTGTSVLDFTGTGASNFVIEPSGSQILEGNVAAAQTVLVSGQNVTSCVGNTTMLTASASFTDAGTITLYSQNAGCGSGAADLVIPSGATMTVTGTLNTAGNGFAGMLEGNVIDQGTIDLVAGTGVLTYTGVGSVMTIEGQLTVESSVANTPELATAAQTNVIDASGGSVDMVGTPGTSGNAASAGTVQVSGTWTQGAGQTTNGSVELVGSALLDFTGTGASSFTVESNGGQSVEGNTAVGQSITLAGFGAGLCGGPGAILSAAGSFTNAGTITLESQSAGCGAGPTTLDIPSGSTMTNTGALTFSAPPGTGGGWTVNGAVDNTSTGTITSSGANAMLTNQITNDGLLSAAAGSALNISTAFTNNGTLQLASTATSNIGAYTQTSQGTLEVGVDHSSNGIQEGLLSVLSINLLGTLKITTDAGSSPVVGDTYPFLSFAMTCATNCTFPVVDGALSGGLAYTPTYGANEVSLVVSSAATQVALAAGAVTVTSTQPLVPGQTLSGTFAITNNGSTTADGGWNDSVYLGTTTTYAPGDSLVDRVEHDANLAGGGNYTADFSGFVPPVGAGPYFLIVVPDSSDLASTQFSDAQASSSGLTVTPIPTLTPGTPVLTTLASGQDLYYQVPVSAADIGISTTLPTAGDADIYASEGSLPTPSHYTLISMPGAASPTVTLPASSPGTWFVVIHGDSGAGDGVGITVDPTALGFGLAAITPTSGGSAECVSGFIPSAGSDEAVTITLRGSGFVAGMTATLGSERAESIDVVSSTTAFATFAVGLTVSGTQPGGNPTPENISVTSGGHTSVLSNGFTVEPTPVSFDCPQAVTITTTGGGSLRAGWVGNDTVTLSNFYNFSIAVPVVRVIATSGNDLVAAPGSSDFQTQADVIEPNFSTPATGPLPPGTLGPNQSVSLTFGVLSTTSVAHADLTVEAQDVDSSQAGPIDWVKQLASYQPATMSDGSWDTVTSEAGSVLGEDEGTYATRLAGFVSQAAADGVSFASEAALLGWVIHEQMAEPAGAGLVCDSVQPGTDLSACLAPSVSGTLSLDDASQPLSQTPLVLSNGLNSYNATSWYDGHFDFWDVPAGTYTLTATGYLPRSLGSVTVGAPGTTTTANEVATSAGGALTGTVTSGGNPVTGAVVTATDADGTLTSDPTGSDGVYTLRGLDAGAVTASATAPGFIASAAATPTVAPGGPTTQDFGLSQGGSITGTVLAVGGGDPPSGTTVTASPDDGSSTSVAGTVNANGTFTITGLLPETGPAPQVYTVTATTNGDATASQDGVTVSGTSTTSGVTLQLGTTATASGRVTNVDTGAPVSGITVYSDGPGAADAVTTDDDGDYTLAGLPAGAQTLIFDPDNVTYAVTRLAVTLTGGATSTENAGLVPYGSVTVKLQTPTGSPLAEQPLLLVGPFNATAGSNYTANLSTDSTGQASLSGLPAGPYDLQVPGSPVQQTFTIAQGNRNPSLTVSVPVATIAGTVATSAASPVSGATVTLSDGSGQIVSAQTSATGTYSFLVTSAGAYGVTASDPTIGVVIATANVVTLPSTTTVNLTGGTASLALTVTAAGDPVDNASVTLSTGAPNDQPVSVAGGTDQTGTLTFDNLLPATYVLTVWASGEAITTQSVVVASGANTQAIALTPGGGIAGTVTDSSGPLSNATVVAKNSSGLEQVAFTSLTGDYAFDSLPTGTYSLSISGSTDSPQVVSSVVVSPPAVTTENVALSTTGDTLTVHLDPASSGGVLTGGVLDVLDSTGTPVASTEIGPARSAADDSDTATLGPLADGPYTLQLEGTGTAIEQKPVVVASGGITTTVDQPAAEALIGGSVDGADLPAIRSRAISGSSVDGVADPSMPTGHALQAHNTPANSGPSAAEVVTGWLSGLATGPPQRADSDNDALAQRIRDDLGVALDPNCSDYSALLALQNKITPASRLKNNTYSNWVDAFNGQQKANGAETAILILQVTAVLGSLAQLGLSIVAPINQLKAAINGYRYLNNIRLTNLANKISAFSVLSFVSGIQAAFLQPSPGASADGLALAANTVSGIISILTAVSSDPALAASPLFGAINNVTSVLANLLSLVEEGESAANQAAALQGTTDQSQSLYLRSLVKLAQALAAFESGLTNEDCSQNTPNNNNNTTNSKNAPLPTPPPPSPGPQTIFNNHVPGDPNGINGPLGVGAAQWLTGAAPLDYQIQFKNEPTASAPAVFVKVTEPVPSDVNPATVQLTGFGFGQHTNEVAPPGSQSITTTEPSGDPEGDVVDVVGTYDPVAATITWTFSTVDPTTGDLDSAADAGFLPPDDAAGDGEGYVGYTAQTEAGLPTGSAVDDQATIVFDRNAPISTPVWSNAIDNTIPTAAVTPLPTRSTPGNVTVHWNGDDGRGSGISTYNVYVSVDGGPLNLWQSHTSATSASYAMQSGHSYGFAAQATSLVGLTGPVPTAAQASTTGGAGAAGYTEVASDGGVFAFGAGYYGSMGGQPLNKPIVGIANTPSDQGYWLVASDGGIFSFGDARFYGSTGGIHLNKPIVGMAPTHDGKGYWLVASDGGVFSYGDAAFHGSTGAIHLNAPIVGMAATPDGGGYWLVASDGGIFSFGDAKFYGSTGSLHLNKPIVGMAGAPGGKGYWLVGSDGGIFTFGDAEFYGSVGGRAINQPVVAMAPSPDGAGYWLTASDGGIFTFGDATFEGSAAGKPLSSPVVGIGTPSSSTP